MLTCSTYRRHPFSDDEETIIQNLIANKGGGGKMKGQNTKGREIHAISVEGSGAS